MAPTRRDGVLHAWLAEPDYEPGPPPQRSELEQVWRLYRLPPARLVPSRR